MRVKIIKRGEPVVVIEDFDTVLVENSGGAPVAVVSRFGPEGSYMVSSIDDDKRFRETLKLLGFDKSFSVTNLRDIMSPQNALPEL